MALEEALEYYCNHCDTTFRCADEGDIVCPRCDVGVITKNGILTHPTNKVMSVSKAQEIISWLGWRGFKIALPDFAHSYPELRPKKKDFVE